MNAVLIIVLTSYYTGSPVAASTIKIEMSSVWYCEEVKKQLIPIMTEELYKKSQVPFAYCIGAKE
jgi:hypothetical protein